MKTLKNISSGSYYYTDDATGATRGIHPGATVEVGDAQAARMLLSSPSRLSPDPSRDFHVVVAPGRSATIAAESVQQVLYPASNRTVTYTNTGEEYTDGTITVVDESIPDVVSIDTFLLTAMGGVGSGGQWSAEEIKVTWKLDSCTFNDPAGIITKVVVEMDALKGLGYAEVYPEESPYRYDEEGNLYGPQDHFAPITLTNNALHVTFEFPTDGYGNAWTADSINAAVWGWAAHLSTVRGGQASVQVQNFCVSVWGTGSSAFYSTPPTPCFGAEQIKIYGYGLDVSTVQGVISANKKQIPVTGSYEWVSGRTNDLKEPLAGIRPGVSMSDFRALGVGYYAKIGSRGTGDGQFTFPNGVAVADSGNVYVLDGGNTRVEKFSSAGAYVAKWGTAGSGESQFNNPSGIAVDSSENVYVVEMNGHRVQKFTSAGVFVAQWGTRGVGNGEFSYPSDIAIDSEDNVYVVDTDNGRIQKFTSTGTYVLQWGTNGYENGQFNSPQGISVGPTDRVYVADRYNHRIQVFNSTGEFITKWGGYGTGDGQFYFPFDAVEDNDGRVHVADYQNSRIQSFTLAGAYLGKTGISGSGDGQMIYPNSLSMSSDGYIYISDSGNYRVQKMTTAFTANTTLASGTTVAAVGYWRLLATSTAGSAVLTGVGGQNFANVKATQAILDMFPTSYQQLSMFAKVVSTNVGAGTITMSKIALRSGMMWVYLPYIELNKVGLVAEDTTSVWKLSGADWYSCDLEFNNSSDGLSGVWLSREVAEPGCVLYNEFCNGMIGVQFEPVVDSLPGETIGQLMYGSGQSASYDAAPPNSIKNRWVRAVATLYAGDPGITEPMIYVSAYGPYMSAAVPSIPDVGSGVSVDAVTEA